MVNKRFVAVGITIAVVGVLILSNWSFLINKVNTRGDFLTANVLDTSQGASEQTKKIEILAGKVSVRLSSEEARTLRAAVSVADTAEGEEARSAQTTNILKGAPQFSSVTDLLKEAEPVIPNKAVNASLAKRRKSTAGAEGEASPLPAIDRWFTLVVSDEQEVVEVTDLESLVSTSEEGESEILQLTREAFNRLKASGNFEVVEPEIIYRTTDFAIPPDDPYYDPYFHPYHSYDPDNPFDFDYNHTIWGINETNADSAWGATTGEGVVVAVLDGNVDVNHLELAENIWENSGEMGGGKENNGIDDDGNGYVDDWRGWDFVNDSGGNDDLNYNYNYWHGTHVAGTIAAVGNNGEGVVGVAPEAKIMPLAVCQDSTPSEPGPCYRSNIANALHYAADMGARVVNTSLGGWGYSQQLANAYAYAHGSDPDAPDNDVVIVVSAGNDSADINSSSSAGYYPASLTSTIAVAAMYHNLLDKMGRATFSNWGSGVDVSAPGSSIWSVSYNGYNGNEPSLMSGTSAAAPHVAGVAALIRSIAPELDNEEVRSVLVDTARSFTTDHFIGSGVVNAEQAIRVVTGAPKWQNLAKRFDVNGDFITTPLDVLILVNAINEGVERDLSSLPATAQPPPYYDVNGDDRLVPLDVLQVINYINREGVGG